MSPTEVKVVEWVVGLAVWAWLLWAAARGWRRGLPAVLAWRASRLFIGGIVVAGGIVAARALGPLLGSFLENTPGDLLIAMLQKAVTNGATIREVVDSFFVPLELVQASAVFGARIDAAMIKPAFPDRGPGAAAVASVAKAGFRALGGWLVLSQVYRWAFPHACRWLAPIASRIERLAFSLDGAMTRARISPRAVRGGGAILETAWSFLLLGWYSAWIGPLGSWILWLLQVPSGQVLAEPVFDAAADAFWNFPVALAGRKSVEIIAGVLSRVFLQ